MCVEECPSCKKFSFIVDLKKQTGTCTSCNHAEKIDEKVWKMKYDEGYKELRAVLMSSVLRREHVIKYFELEKPNSPYATYLLTDDVVAVLKTEAPAIYSNLVRSSAIKCAVR